MKSISLILTTYIVYGLLGCATPYQYDGFTGGYSDTQLAPDLFRVVFRGNGFTAAERVQDFALLRASELTLQRGYKFFAITDENNSNTTSSFTTPGYAETTGMLRRNHSGNIHLNPYGGSYSGTSSGQINTKTTYSPPQTHVSYKHKSKLTVRAFQAKPSDISTFDAVFLQQSLKQKYRIK